jgi:hypothetical protein
VALDMAMALGEEEAEVEDKVGARALEEAVGKAFEALAMVEADTSIQMANLGEMDEENEIGLSVNLG